MADFPDKNSQRVDLRLTDQSLLFLDEKKGHLMESDDQLKFANAPSKILDRAHKASNLNQVRQVSSS